MLNPHKPKYFPFYMALAEEAAQQSVATRHKVGAIIVTPTGMISPGWNGMPAGMDNCCESGPLVVDEAASLATGVHTLRHKTNPAVIHAERNAIDKMTRQGIATLGSLLFVTLSPCFECCKAIHGLGLNAIYYRDLHDCQKGWPILNAAGVPLIAM